MSSSQQSAQFSFGEVPVKAEFSSNRATPEELVQMANRIWKEVQEEKIPEKDTARIDAYLKELQERHKDFQVSFPMVLRWMVQRNKYSASAFKKYLELHAYKPNASREDFLGLQADYLKILERYTNTKAKEADLAEYRKRVLEVLQHEDREFTESHKKFGEEYDAEQKEYARARREALFAVLSEQKKQRDEMAAASAKADAPKQ